MPSPWPRRKKPGLFSFGRVLLCCSGLSEKGSKQRSRQRCKARTKAGNATPSRRNLPSQVDCGDVRRATVPERPSDTLDSGDWGGLELVLSPLRIYSNTRRIPHDLVRDAGQVTATECGRGCAVWHVGQRRRPRETDQVQSRLLWWLAALSHPGRRSRIPILSRFLAKRAG